MARHLILMDAFKGSISSIEGAEAVASGIRAHDPTAIIDFSPVADGGEGTLDVYLALGYELKTAMTMDLAGRQCEVQYAVKDSDAVIEVARICGLPMRRVEDDPIRMNTRGVGRLINQLRDQGITHIRLALGGTGTTDGGLGLLAEVGCQPQDASSVPISFQTNPLLETQDIRCSAYPVRLEALVDVTAPYWGQDGPAYLFGPQKGLLPQDIVRLDQQLERIGRLLGLEGIAGRSAGGLGGAVHALGGTIVPGARTILQHLRVAERMQEADYVWTGEGRVDRQSQIGKLPGEVARMANAASVPCLILAGIVEEKMPQALDCRSIHVGQAITLDPEQTKIRMQEQAQKWLEELSVKQG
ncbi:glycerate kinase [Exiguobacterium sp. SL14]|nr:glycerate kinase [Exiguobacterium sp. SL14]MCY1690002.1 glycerate kinase [Exiguobacterium sp. SL14]